MMVAMLAKFQDVAAVCSEVCVQYMLELHKEMLCVLEEEMEAQWERESGNGKAARTLLEAVKQKTCLTQPFRHDANVKESDTLESEQDPDDMFNFAELDK